LLPEGFERQATRQLQKLPRHPFELLNQRPSLFELATRRLIFEV
jgi:hypothetical protein